jgi:Tfp pilus assembly protein PilN
MSQQINLLDASLRTHRLPLDAATMAVALAVLVAVLLGYQQYAERQLAMAVAQRDSANAKSKELQARVTEIGAAAGRAPNKALQDEIARAEATAKNWQELLSRLNGTGIGNTEGHAKFLEALARQHAEGVWLTHIIAGDAGGGEFALEGRVVRPDLLAGYIQMLNREDALRGKAIGQLSVSEKTEAAAPAAQPGGIAKQGSKGPKDRESEVRYVEFSIGSASKAAEAGAAR